jgi:TRAP-type uncharacterized transport system substrate-binding protein
VSRPVAGQCSFELLGVVSATYKAIIEILMRIVFPAVLVLVFVTLSACDNKPVELRMVSPYSPIDREIAQDFAGLLERNTSINVSLTEHSATDEAALDSLLDGTADIALVSNNTPYRPGVATVMPFYPTVLHIGYVEGRDISSGTDLLRGATVFAGAPGSASRQMFERITDRLDLAPDDYTFVDFAEEAPDVFVVFAPISRDRLEQFPEIRLYSLGSPEDIGRGSFIDAATLLNPQLDAFVIPEGTYDTATPEAVLTVSVDMLLVARSDLSEAVVYDLVQEVYGLRPAMASLNPGLFRHLSDGLDASRSTFVLHSGLLAYSQRDAPSVYERYSGVAEVLVTLFIALASALIAGMRIYRMRRKNRIDEFYRDAISIGDTITDNATAEERSEAVRKLEDLQTRAFEMLVDEQLAADESFRIFITLANDIIRRLDSAST